MKIVKEFSRFADEYNKHNIIQSEVAKRLTSMLDKSKYSKVLDLGSGAGAVYENFLKQGIIVDEFTAFDFSKEMLSLHPNAKNIKKKHADFNEINSFFMYKKNEFNILISASALQWSSDLSKVLASISPLASEYYFAFFTSNTFATLHDTAGIKSPIYSKKCIISSLKEHYNIETEIKDYKLYFDSVYEMLKYIKRSGVSGGSRQLSYEKIKSLIKNYPLDYLEFEVLFIKAYRN